LLVISGEPPDQKICEALMQVIHVKLSSEILQAFSNKSDVSGIVRNFLAPVNAFIFASICFVCHNL
jgi:hypothetical protein